MERIKKLFTIEFTTISGFAKKK